jgi:hypothetical protein
MAPNYPKLASYDLISPYNARLIHPYSVVRAEIIFLLAFGLARFLNRFKLQFSRLASPIGDGFE